MKKNEALEYIKNHPGVIVKLDWWDDYMGIKSDGNKFYSIPGDEIDIKFLLSGNYVISSYIQDSELGGLFNL